MQKWTQNRINGNHVHESKCGYQNLDRYLKNTPNKSDYTALCELQIVLKTSAKCVMAQTYRIKLFHVCVCVCVCVLGILPVGNGYMIIKN